MNTVGLYGPSGGERVNRNNNYQLYLCIHICIQPLGSYFVWLLHAGILLYQLATNLESNILFGKITLMPRNKEAASKVFAWEQESHV